MTLVHLLRDLVTSYALERRVYDQLSHLDDRLLADIGLERGNLREAARAAARLSQKGVVSLAEVQAAREPVPTSWLIGHGMTVRTA